MTKLERTKISYQDPKTRINNFEEVCLGYTKEEAIKEAQRCLQCKSPKCMPLCPVEIDIPKFIKKIAEEDFEGAYKTLLDYTRLPGVCGRVCPQEDQCESTCILGIKGDPIAIGKLERFAADYALENKIEIKEEIQKNKKKVAIIGSGPAGITCAGDLARLGYDITIFEALHEAGGVLTYGIPEFRLPKEKVVKKELEGLEKLGVKIETNTIVGRTISIEDIFEEGFDAIFIGSGAGSPLFLKAKGENLNGVFSANEFLTRANLMKAYKKDVDTPIFVGEKILVIGGGNVAMDAARTARRFGKDVTIVYRREKEDLPAREEEVENAIEEGINFIYLASPLEIIGDEKGKVTGLKAAKVEIEKETRKIKVLEDTDFEIKADTIILALGTNPNPLIPSTTENLQVDEKMRIKADQKGQTNLEGIFAGGDNVTGSATVILAMGAGKKAAQAIDHYIRGKK